MKVEDLDILRSEPRKLIIGGKEIDVSFIPCGVTFEVDAIVRELQNIDQNEILKNGEATKRAFELSVELCAAFCKYQYPELDKDFFMSKTDVNQIKAFSAAIKDALVKAYAGIETSPKNLKAPKKKESK